MSENNQNDVAQPVFIIKPKTMVLGRPVYHVKESKGGEESKVLAVCPWLDDAERIARALSESEGGSVRVMAEDEPDAVIEEGQGAPHVVLPGSDQPEQSQDINEETVSMPEESEPTEEQTAEDLMPPVEPVSPIEPEQSS